MEEDKKPGRGLQDYAHLFLSRTSKKSPESDSQPPESAKPDDIKPGTTEAQGIDTKSRSESLKDFSCRLFPQHPDEQRNTTPQSAEPVKEKAYRRPYAIALSAPSRSLSNAFLTMNLCMDFASRNLKVLVINADLRFPSMILLANLKMAGTRSKAQATSIEAGERGSAIEMVTLDMDITVLNSPWEDEQNPITEEITKSANRADIILINTSMGFRSNAKAIFKAADEIILSTGADPARLIDTYCMVKMIHQLAGDARMGIIITASEHESANGFKKLNQAAQQFLTTSLTCYGYIPWDFNVTESIRKKSLLRPDCPTAQYIHTIGDKLLKAHLDQQQQRSFKEPTFIDKIFIVSGQAMRVEDLSPL